MRKLTLNLNVRGKSAVLMLIPSSFVWQSKYKRCGLKSSCCRLWSSLLPPTAVLPPLRCSCSFGTPRPAPEFESRGERKNVSRRSLSRTSGPACLPSTRLPPADSATQPAFAVRQNKHAQHSYSSALVPARFGIRPSSTATGARQHNAGGRGGWGGGAGRGVAVFVRSQVPRTPCVPSLFVTFVHGPSVVFPVCAARSHAALLHDAGGHRAHGNTRRKSTPVCVAGGGIDGVRSGHVTRLLHSSFRKGGRSAGREREAHRRESALADARVITPKGLNLGAGLVPGG